MFRNILFGIIGMAFLLLFAFLISDNRKQVKWKTVGWGFILQFVFGVIVLYWEPGQKAVRIVADLVAKFLGFSSQGSQFLFSKLADPSSFGTFGFQFAFMVLPTIIFFASVTSIAYHYGWLNKVVELIAKVMSKTMKTSGAESLCAASNIFLGQTEAPLLIKPFLKTSTVSEMGAVMIAGFGTIACSVMGGYIMMGMDASYILTASVMAAPCSLMFAKIIFPETGNPETLGMVKLPKQKIADNGIDAAARGASDGLMLALNVGAMLIAFIAIIALINAILGKLDFYIDGKLLGGAIQSNNEYAGFFPGSIKTIFSYLFWPLAWVLGVPTKECSDFAYLVGTKISINEFVAYSELASYIKAATLSAKTVKMATFALCGFANFSSIAIQLGGIGAMVPERRGDLAKLGMKAMIGGAIVSLFTATIAGMLS